MRPHRLRWRGLIRRESRRFLLVFLIGSGAGCGLVAVLFHHALDLAWRCLAGAAGGLHEGPVRIAARVAVPTAVGAVLAWLVPRFSPNAGGGLTLVRGAYAKSPARLDVRTFLGTFVANPLSLGAGTPLGPEGPTVVLTSAFATGLARLAGLPARLVRGMIPIGTAAGIAAIFATPITGVVFALEEVIGEASRGVLGGALLAAVAAAVVQRQALGGVRLLPAAPAAWRDPRELLGFALVGVIAGVVAGAIPRVVPALRRGLHRLTARLGGWAGCGRGALAGLMVGLLGVLSPDMLGSGYAPVARWLGGGGSAGTAAVAFAAKAVGVCLALAAPLVGGVFAPSLFLGASLGAATGHAATLLFPGSAIDPAAYALVGMGAFFAGFLRTPLASVLIVFELTGDYGLVVPLMLAVALSSLAARRLSRETLVERQLAEAGIADRESSTDPLARQRVRDFMSVDVVTFRSDESLLDAVRRAAGTRHAAYPVVDAGDLLVGLADADDVDQAAREGKLGEPVSSVSRKPAVVATPDEALDAVSYRLGHEGETRCAVVESQGRPKLVGFLSPTDLLRARVRGTEHDSGFTLEFPR